MPERQYNPIAEVIDHIELNHDSVDMDGYEHLDIPKETWEWLKSEIRNNCETADLAYEALENALEVMVWDWGGEPLNAQPAIDQARAALAKARGKAHETKAARGEKA